MITFKNWTITTDGFLARQYDNLSRAVEIVGDVPEGWLWELLVQAGDAQTIFALNETDTGLGCVLTAEQLSIAGYYTVQLRAHRGEVVRHTNTAQTFVPRSLTGTGTWPSAPQQSAFSDGELLQAMQDTGLVDPAADESGALFTDEDGALYTL